CGRDLRRRRERPHDPPPRRDRGAARSTGLDHARRPPEGARPAGGPRPLPLPASPSRGRDRGRTPRPEERPMTIDESARALAGVRAFAAALGPATAANAQDKSPRVYENKLTPIAAPRPILAAHPEFIEPVREVARFEAPAIVEDEGADLSVRAWR